MSDILTSLTKEQSDSFKSQVEGLAVTVQKLSKLSPETVSGARSVLEKHKFMKEHFGYAGGVEGARKMLAGVE